jgi:hypothetical protein
MTMMANNDERVANDDGSNKEGKGVKGKCDGNEGGRQQRR